MSSRIIPLHPVSFAAAALLVGVFFVPIVPAPFGAPLSLFNLLSGSFAGGALPPARVALLLAFVVASALLVASALQLLKVKHETVA